MSSVDKEAQREIERILTRHFLNETTLGEARDQILALFPDKPPEGEQDLLLSPEERLDAEGKALKHLHSQGKVVGVDGFERRDIAFEVELFVAKAQLAHAEQYYNSQGIYCGTAIIEQAKKDEREKILGLLPKIPTRYDHNKTCFNCVETIKRQSLKESPHLGSCSEGG